MHAFGLAGDEAAFPIEPSAPAFAIARDAGLTAAPTVELVRQTTTGASAQ